MYYSEGKLDLILALGSEGNDDVLYIDMTHNQGRKYFDTRDKPFSYMSTTNTLLRLKILKKGNNLERIRCNNSRHE